MPAAQSETHENKGPGKKPAYKKSQNWREREQENAPTNSNNPRLDRRPDLRNQSWRPDNRLRDGNEMNSTENKGKQDQPPAGEPRGNPSRNVGRSPRPQATAPPQKLAPQPTSTKLTPETAKVGRIVWMPKFKEHSIANNFASPGAEEHPAVIMAVDTQVQGHPPTVQVLPITSWESKTVDQKWNKGKGVGFQKYYILIWHDDVETEEAVEREDKYLVLSNMELLRKRSYVAFREEKIKIEMGNLDVYTSNGNPDIFLMSDSLEYLKKLVQKRIFDMLSHTTVNSGLPVLSPRELHRPPRPPFRCA